MSDGRASVNRVWVERSRIKGPLSTDWFLGLSFRRRHLTIMVMTATKRQDEELGRILHEGLVRDD